MLCHSVHSQTTITAGDGGIFGEKHIPGGVVEYGGLMRWRDSRKLRKREAGWAADLNSRNCMEQLTVRQMK